MVFRFILKPEALDGVLAKCLNSSGHLADFILAVHTFDFAGCIACRQRPHPLAKPRNRSGNATRRNKQAERDQCQGNKCYADQSCPDCRVGAGREALSPIVHHLDQLLVPRADFR
ncbi:hypothetical protein D3C80_1219410 [compost metagenome]